MKLERKMQVLSDTEERLRAMLEEPQPPVVRDEEEKPLIIPMESQDEPEQHVQLFSPQKMKERLASIDSLVTEQKLSLAETERNILKRERQDLHAQIRQMDAMHRQNQMEMQKQMKDQMESLMETFQNVGKVMLGGIQTAQHAAENPGPHQPQAPGPLRERSVESVRQLQSFSAEDRDLSPRALEQQRKQERIEREAAFERRLRAELLEPFSTAHTHAHARPPMESGSSECMIARRRDADDRLLGSGLVQDLCSQLEVTSPAVACFPQSFRPDLGDIRSVNSAALRALRSSCVFIPVCSWYDSDDTGEPNEGSVGRLARMDPVDGEDWVDEFLVQVLVALRLEQEFPSGSTLGWIMPVLVGGRDPKSCDASFGPFPWERLKQLPSRPSLESAKIVAQVLADCGVSTPEGFLRLSVRETISAVIGFAGVQLDRFPIRSEAMPKLARRMAGMAVAERSAREAKGWQERSHLEPEPAKAERELKRLKRACLEQFEGCYREVREDGARALAVGALRRRGLLDDGDVDAQLEDTEENAGGLEDSWVDVSWQGEPEKVQWDKFGRHWDSVEHTLGGDDTEGSETSEGQQDKQADNAQHDTSAPADIEEVLRKLQAAVAETHDKHSQLLQVTRDAKRLDNLAGGLSEAGREALRDSGVTFTDLIDMARKETGDGGVVFNPTALPKIGLDPKSASPDLGPTGVKQSKQDAAMVEKFMMAPHLWDREGEWDMSGGTDEDERKERLREDLEALQGHLKRKGAKTQISSETVEALMKDDGIDDGICGVLNSLLYALGKDAGPLGADAQLALPALAAFASADQASAPAPGDGEAQTAEESTAPGEDTTADQDEDSFVDKGTEEGIGRLDKEMADYLERLGREEDAQQEVMQYLTSGLAEVRASAESVGGATVGYGDDLEAGMERKRMEASQMAMEKSMKRFEEAMSHARRLLSSDAGSEKGADVEGTGGGGAVGGGLTAAEQEAVKLEEDVRRRAEQAEALAQENMMLREQLSRGRWSSGSVHAGALEAREEESRIHWSEAIQDPELASKYKSYGDSDDAYFVSGSGQDAGQLDMRFLRPEMLHEVLNYGDGENERPHLAWALENVNSLSHITRASVFETVLEERVRKSKKVLKAKADAYAKELELIQSEEAEANATLERVQEEQAAMVREGAKAAKGAVVMLKEREVRVARERCEELAAKRGEVEQELQRLVAEEEALDWRAELERMKEKEEEESEVVRAEIEKMKEEGGLETEEGRSKEAELQKKLTRIHETWVLRRNLKEKEIEIEVLGQKMEDDEEGLKLEKKRLMTAFQENANTAQEELVHSLLDMEEHVAKTARGRCRPEVMSSLSGVRKVMGAVQKHRAQMAMAMEEEKRQEREKLKEQQQAELERAETAKLEEEIAKARGTTDMALRERRLQLIADLVAKQRQATLQSATALLEDAEKAVAAGGAGEGDALPRFERMQLRTVEGGAKHARSFAGEAKTLLAELQSAAASAAGGAADAGNPDAGAADEEGGAGVQERMERVEAVEKAVEEAEGRLSEQMREAQATVERLQKLDLNKASRDQVQRVAEEREAVTALVADLGALLKVEDAGRVKGREFAAREQRLRTAWERVAPRIEEALRRILVKGDAYLDSVQAALKAGKVSSAVAELGNAQQAYDKFKAAKKPQAQPPAAVAPPKS